MAQLSPAVTAIVAAVLGGLVGGGIVRFTMRGPAPSASATREPGAAPDTSDLEKRVAQLERGSSRSVRAERMERAAAQAAPSGAGDEPAPAGAGRPHIDDPVFENAVRDVLEQVEDERREERSARGAERRKRMAERWTGELASELGLSDAQKQKVAEAVQEYFESLRALRDSDAGPASRSEWREAARSEREKAEGKLGQILDSGQLQKYKALDEDKKLGFGGGGRGRRQRE